MGQLLRAVVTIVLLLTISGSAAAAKPGMTWRDLVQVRKVVSPIISDDGRWIGVEARPDRGDGEVIFREVDGSDAWSIPRGTAPAISADGSWGAAKEQPSFEDRETAEEDDELSSAAVLVGFDSGEQTRFEDTEQFGFSADGKWFVVKMEAPEEEEAEEDNEAEPETESEEEPATGEEEDDEPGPRDAGTQVVLVRLSDGARFEYESVMRWRWSSVDAWLAIVQETESGLGNRLFVLACADADPLETAIAAQDSATWDALAWAEELPLFAAVAADTRDPEQPVGTTLIEFSGATGEVTSWLVDEDVEKGWTLPLDNALEFSRDGARLFFGLREGEPDEPEVGEADEEAEFDILDVDMLLAEREVDVWHYDDPRVKTHERKSFEERDEHRYLAVVHRSTGDVVRVADPDLADVEPPESGLIAVGADREPWLQEMTWDGFYQDVWTVDLQDGTRVKVAEHVQDTVSRSPQGGFVVWFSKGVFFMHDTATGEQRDISSALGVSFANEDHDYPRDPDDYGVGGWLRDDSAVLLYDKYDIWLVPTGGGEIVNLSGGKGRVDRRTYRVAGYDRGGEGLDPEEDLLLVGFDELAKNSSIWTVDLASQELELRREDERYYSIKAKAKDATRFLYTEEAYTVFNDLWIAGEDFRKPRQLTDLNPGLDDFDLGEASLVEWASEDGIPLQGILIKPANHDPDKRYPVLVYYYRFFSPRLHRFNDPVINHRPSFYAYAGDGYAVFLPDIRFQVGRPGHSAAKSLIPGVQKIIDLGIADPDAIALHGHSWSGYQTAQIITETDLFACAVAGAPVSNMTSAYGGIRYGTGLSRMFQYEKSQSRIGATLWERRDLYIENSPVFFADRINTPLLIQFGDEDGAVPWTQGIELYMAMRRLDKPCVFLQYHGEPHHLKKYPNKLDYTLRMKAFIDHFCKGAEAPDWWTSGEAYEGEE
jgi:dipeptidyl aminopeptidase/acylaminoacyl peptidase